MIALPRTPRRRAPAWTAMIDVVFLLLIFFMLAARLDQPQALALIAAGAGPDWSGPPRLVDVFPQSLTLNGQILTPDALAQALPELMTNADDLVVLRARDGATLQRLVDIMSWLDRAGFGNLVLVETR